MKVIWLLLFVLSFSNVYAKCGIKIDFDGNFSQEEKSYYESVAIQNGYRIIPEEFLNSEFAKEIGLSLEMNIIRVFKNKTSMGSPIRVVGISDEPLFIGNMEMSFKNKLPSCSTELDKQDITKALQIAGVKDLDTSTLMSDEKESLVYLMNEVAESEYLNITTGEGIQNALREGNMEEIMGLCGEEGKLCLDDEGNEDLEKIKKVGALELFEQVFGDDWVNEEKELIQSQVSTSLERLSYFSKQQSFNTFDLAHLNLIKSEIASRMIRLCTNYQKIGADCQDFAYAVAGGDKAGSICRGESLCLEKLAKAPFDNERLVEEINNFSNATRKYSQYFQIDL